MTGKRFVPTDFDKQLGKIITITRNRFGMSQKDLAKSLGVTFQQVQKYETGGNRISAAKLNTIAECFGMSISALLHGSAQEYLHDADIKKTIELMYKMNATQRRFILQSAAYVAGSTPPGPVRHNIKSGNQN